MKRVLIVDDEQMVVKSLKEGLRKYENELFVTDIAFDASSAIDLIKKYPYHVVVSDIRLPDKSGVDVFWELKKTQPACKFIAITAFSDPLIKQKVEELGALKYLEKPFDFKEFEDLILSCFEEEKNFSNSEGLTDLIEFTTLLQLINMEKKSVIVWVKLGEKKGYVAFENGEIVDAKFGKLRGVEAANYLIIQNKGEIKIEKGKKAKNKTIDIPFMTLLLNAVKSKDDLSRDKNQSNTKKIKNDPDSFCESLKKSFVGFQKKHTGIETFLVFDLKEKRFCFSEEKNKDISVIKDNLLHLWKIAEDFFQQKHSINLYSIEVFLRKKVFIFKKIKVFASEMVFIAQLSGRANIVMIKQGLDKFLEDFLQES